MTVKSITWHWHWIENGPNGERTCIVCKQKLGRHQSRYETCQPPTVVVYK